MFPSKLITRTSTAVLALANQVTPPAGYRVVVVGIVAAAAAAATLTLSSGGLAPMVINLAANDTYDQQASNLFVGETGQPIQATASSGVNLTLCWYFERISR